ncbi:MAG: iron-containing alcohol dehydrogenase [Spirochaetaceae bacterium]|jgi:alcohol dehydrogenase YqhD (iron-dependent ADH family)|nr:iron-containing alcohol dehydrogenase [Spirochaetaceae bacterium]
MNNFQYYTPTRVVFGKDTESQAGTLVSELGCKKVLIHFGGQSAIKSGLVDRVCGSLADKQIPCVTLGGVVPNPLLSKVREGIAVCKKEGVDFILAVGGGSVIDSAKAIAYGAVNEGDVWDYYAKTRVPTKALPVGCVLTISAAGSEMSDSSVITNDDGRIKRGCNNNMCRPKFAIMNPELTFSVPAYQIASGSVDIVMHTLERWFLSNEADAELTDAIAAGLMRVVIKNSLILKKDPRNYNAAAEIMWASSLSHNGLTGCGRIGGDFSAHQIGHELGGLFDVAHGASISAVWATWARYVYKALPVRFAELGRDVFGLSYRDNPADTEKTALVAIGKFEAYFKSLDMPVSIGDFGIKVTEEQIKDLAWKCSFFGKRKVGSFRPLDVSDLENLYRLAK